VTGVYQLCIADKSLGSVAELKVPAGTKTDRHNTYVTVKSSLVSSSAYLQSVGSLLCLNHMSVSHTVHVLYSYVLVELGLPP
jgi:hypothetical protein